MRPESGMDGENFRRMLDISEAKEEFGFRSQDNPNGRAEEDNMAV